MTDTAASIEAEVLAGIVPEGVSAPLVLTKAGAGGGELWNPGTGAGTPHSAQAMQVSAESAARAGLTLQESEIAVSVYGLAVEPTTSDAVEVFGKNWTVTQWQAKRFGPDAYAYMVKISR